MTEPATMRLPGIRTLRLLPAVMALLLLQPAPAAHARGGDGVVLDIPVFVGGYGIAFFEETARLFEKQVPGVRVNLYGDPRIADKVRIRVIEGDMPDATDADLLYPSLIASGKILDLTPYLNELNWEGDARWRDTFLPGVLDRWRTRGRVYGLPFSHSVWCIFYNRAIFRAHGWTEPRTWDEFFALCEKMQQAGITPMSLPGVFMRYGDAFLRAAHYNLAGPGGYEAANALAPGSRTDPRHIRAAEVLRRLATRHLQKGWEGMSHTSAQLAFLEGRTAMTISGSWILNEMKGRFPPGFELGTMNFPVFPDGIGDPGALQTGSSYYFIFAGSENIRETVNFFKFLTSRERAAAFVRTVDSPVALKGVPDDAWSPNMRDTAALIARSRATYGVPPGSIGYTSLLNQAMADARAQLMTGRISAAEFGRRLEEASAAIRDREANPGLVHMRHAGKASVLLAIIGGAFVWAAWPRRRTSAGAGGGADATFLGRLTAGLGAGFILPSFLLFGLFVLLPGILSLTWAFSHWNGISPRTWAGAFHFKWLLLESDVFWQALGNNLFLMLVPAVVIIPLALALAGLIHRGVRGSRFFKACFLFPNILGGVAAVLLWLNAYDPHGGLVNQALVHLGGWLAAAGAEGPGAWLRSFEGYAWLSQDNLYRALVPVYIWLATGFNLVLYLAAMEGIDVQLYEAAELEGASKLRQFLTITLPLIREVIAISFVFLVIGGLNTFEMIWLLTSQDPSSGVHVLGTWMVTNLFREFEIGRATAIAAAMFVLVFAGSAVVLRAFHREPVEQ